MLYKTKDIICFVNRLKYVWSLWKVAQVCNAVVFYRSHWIVLHEGQMYNSGQICLERVTRVTSDLLTLKSSHQVSDLPLRRTKSDWRASVYLVMLEISLETLLSSEYSLTVDEISDEGSLTNNINKTGPRTSCSLVSGCCSSPWVWRLWNFHVLNPCQFNVPTSPVLLYSSR